MKLSINIIILQTQKFNSKTLKFTKNSEFFLLFMHIAKKKKKIVQFVMKYK